MDLRNRWLPYLLVANVVCLAVLAVVVLDLQTQMSRLSDLATRQSLLAQQWTAADTSSQELCTRCHTELRFTGIHGTEDELVRLIRRLREDPDANVHEREIDKVHAAMSLLKCIQCHSSGALRELSRMDTVQRLSVIEKMATKAGSHISADEVADILKAYDAMSGF